ncbi:MAG: zinc ribbon domain-containing protein [Candidatus Margulisiibacteriota bacterium]
MSMCQSCGMPMKQDPKQGGTNADGSKNTEYCSYCYQDGKYFNPDFTAEQMQKFCIGKMKEMGMPKFIGWILTRGIPKLKRWKK